MKVPFTWRPTGWFMVGWSAEIAPGESAAWHYFGVDLVAFRNELGELHVLDAHCAHLGANLARGGKVDGACIRCAYHGWAWSGDGVNTDIPYEDRPNLSKQIRSWPVVEVHECIFLWNDPAGGPPRWEMPDVFRDFEGLEGDPTEYYRAYPEGSTRYRDEPVHPQVTLENACDSIHFKYVHAATVNPVLIDHEAVGNEFRTRIGWPVPTPEDPDRMALTIRGISSGVGNNISVFEGSVHYRLIFCTTPVDIGRCDMFYSIWWPKDSGDQSTTLPQEYIDRVEAEFLSTLWDDLEIWRYQVYVEHPALAQIDARPYASIRKWARQFYEVPAEQS